MKLLVIFTSLLNLGFVEPMYETNDDRELYNLHLANGKVIKYAYKEEILEWIDTGTFEYNEALTVEDLLDHGN